MWGFFRRWWRRHTNPWPLAGQMWRVDGVGGVLLEHVKHREDSPCRVGPCGGEAGFNSNKTWHVHALTSEGQPVIWPGRHLLEQGVMWAPRSLTEITTADTEDRQREKS